MAVLRRLFRCHSKTAPRPISMDDSLRGFGADL